MERKISARTRHSFDYWAYAVDITTRMYANLVEASPTSEGEPPSEIIIERYHNFWCMVVGSHHIPITNRTNGRAVLFRDYVDPMTVTLALKAQANGPINVIWNL